MNWLDVVIIIILVAGVWLGVRMGLISAAFIAAGGVVGWLLASWFSDDLSGLAGDSLSSRTWVTVIAYAIIIIVSVVLAMIVGKLARPLLGALALAPVEKLGGFVMGLVFGVAIAGALITVGARFGYNLDVPRDEVAQQMAASLVSKVGASADEKEIAEQVAGQVEESVGSKASSKGIAGKVAKIVKDKAPGEDISGKVAEVLKSKVVYASKTRGWVEPSLRGSFLVPVFIDIADRLPGQTLGFVPDEFGSALDILDQEIEARKST